MHPRFIHTLRIDPTRLDAVRLDRLWKSLSDEDPEALQGASVSGMQQGASVGRMQRCQPGRVGQACCLTAKRQRVHLRQGEL